MIIETVPDRQLSPPDEKLRKFAECEECGGDILEGDECYCLDDEYFCNNCVERSYLIAEIEDDYWED